jgi:hypothetical protein
MSRDGNMAGIQRNPQQRSNNLCVKASSSFIAERGRMINRRLYWSLVYTLMHVQESLGLNGLCYASQCRTGTCAAWRAVRKSGDRVYRITVTTSRWPLLADYKWAYLTGPAYTNPLTIALDYDSIFASTSMVRQRWWPCQEDKKKVSRVHNCSAQTHRLTVWIHEAAKVLTLPS